MEHGSGYLEFGLHGKHCIHFRIRPSEGIRTDPLTNPQMFELIVGYPPFDNLMPNKDDLIREWVAMFGPLPEEWKHHNPPPQADDAALDPVTLADWLHDTYFDGEKKVRFAEAQIEVVGELLQWMMRYRPGDRPKISEVLEHDWFRKNPFAHGNDRV